MAYLVCSSGVTPSCCVRSSGSPTLQGCVQGRNGTEVHFLVGLPRCLALINSELWARVGAFFLVLVLVKALGLALDF